MPELSNRLNVANRSALKLNLKNGSAMSRANNMQSSIGICSPILIFLPCDARLGTCRSHCARCERLRGARRGIPKAPALPVRRGR